VTTFHYNLSLGEYITVVTNLWYSTVAETVLCWSLCFE